MWSGFWSLLPVAATLIAMGMLYSVRLSLLVGSVCGIVLSATTQVPVSINLHSIAFGSYGAALGFAAFMTTLSTVLIKLGALHALYHRLARAMYTRVRAQMLLLCFVILGLIDEENACMRAANFFRARFAERKLSRAKLAFIIDQVMSCGPSITGCSIFFVFFTSLVNAALAGSESPIPATQLTFHSIAFNFYAWFSLGIVVCSSVSSRDFAIMTALESRAKIASTTPYPLTCTSHERRQTTTLLPALVHGLCCAGPIMATMLLAFCFQQVVQSLGTASIIADNFLRGVHPTCLPMLAFASAALCSLVMNSALGSVSVTTPTILAAVFTLHHPHVVTVVTTASLLGGTIFGGQASALFETTMQAATGSRCDSSQHLLSKRPYQTLAAVLTLLSATITIFASKTLDPQARLF